MGFARRGSVVSGHENKNPKVVVLVVLKVLAVLVSVLVSVLL